MIYLFESEQGASIVYDDSTLTNEEKELGMAVEVLPEPEDIEGMIPVLFVNKAENDIWYEYIPKPTDDLYLLLQ